MLKLTIITLAMIISTGSSSQMNIFSKKEKTIINSLDSSEGIMHVLSSDNSKDLAFLQKKAKNISRNMLHEPEYATLKKRMITTVTDPQHPGVGIAAPQVGISKKLIAVQRFDKADYPFEFFINPKITHFSPATGISEEGCLSVPETSGCVMRHKEITISYRDENYTLQKEIITGFTAIIFQHEIDHLNGILFIDRLINK